MKATIIAAVAACMMGAAVLPAHADITYTGDAAANGLSATYTVVTDGAQGLLTDYDIVSFDVTVASDTQSVSFDNTDGSHSINGGLFASPEAITLTPDGGFEFLGADAGLESTRGGIEFYLANGPSSTVSTTNFASVSAAPEPGVWTLMLAGVAMIGATLRFGRRQRLLSV